MNAPPKNFMIACGMYAFSPALQNAWRELFSALPKFLKCDDAYEISLSFTGDDDTYVAPNLLIAHVCGYPYLKKWRDTHRPVCVPMFAVNGCEQTQYSSWFITHADSDVTDLESARGKRVAVSNPLSNSGMNVLRHAIAGLAGGERFFDEVCLSGSHMHSIDMIVRQQVELAAIDVVTYALKMAHEPELQKNIRIIGQSAHTTALPFIAPASVSIGYDEITHALNASLNALDASQRAVLNLNGFQRVTTTDYDNIAALETFALEQQYPEII